MNTNKTRREYGTGTKCNQCHGIYTKKLKEEHLKSEMHINALGLTKQKTKEIKYCKYCPSYFYGKTAISKHITKTHPEKIAEHYTENPIKHLRIMKFSNQQQSIEQSGDSGSGASADVRRIQSHHHAPTPPMPQAPISARHGSGKKRPPSSSQHNSLSNASDNSSFEDILKDFHTMNSTITQEFDTAIDQAQKDQEHIDKHGGGSQSYRSNHHGRH